MMPATPHWKKTRQVVTVLEAAREDAQLGF